MKTIDFRDIEQLSAYLDGELPGAEAARLEKRLRSEPELAGALEDLRQTRSLLRKTPQQRVPRNFTLTRKMAGIKPPVPRSVPAFSWASAVATLLFFFTLGSGVVGKFAFGAAAPMAASAPMEASGVGGGLVAPEAPSEKTVDMAVTATPEFSAFAVAEPPPLADARSMNNTQETQTEPVNAWLIVWPAAAILFLGAAVMTRYVSILAFRKKTNK